MNVNLTFLSDKNYVNFYAYDSVQNRFFTLCTEYEKQPLWTPQVKLKRFFIQGTVFYDFRVLMFFLGSLVEGVEKKNTS